MLKKWWQKFKDLRKWVWVWEMKENDCTCGKKMSLIHSDSDVKIYSCRCGKAKKVWKSGTIQWQE